jgi:hypothetical protein
MISKFAATDFSNLNQTGTLRDLQAMERVGSWGFASQVESPGASPLKKRDFALAWNARTGS